MSTERKSNWTEAERRFIFNKTDGICKHCKKPLVFQNRMKGQRGAWHVDHGRSLYDGGSNHLKNLWALCVGCNLDKSTSNGTKYDSQFKNATMKGKVIDGLNRALLDDFLWTGSSGIKNNERRVKK